MSLSRSGAVVTVLATTALALTAPPALAEDSTVSVGIFTESLLGVSVFKQTGTSVTVKGRYLALAPQRSFFTVAYGNVNCDPAQAFPVGPFATDRRGRASLNATVAAPANLIAGTQSISVRRGDNSSDLDGDGIKGPNDVVAIPGNPSVGLIECDVSPVTSS